MAKQVVIEIPDWVDEGKIKDMVERYIEFNLPDSVTKEGYTELANVNVEEIVEFPLERELKNIDELRKKAKERCQS